MNSRFVLPASLFSCCVCVVNVRRKALLLVLLCDIGTLHAKKVTELLHKQQHTQREKREAEQNRRILKKTCKVLDAPIFPFLVTYSTRNGLIGPSGVGFGFAHLYLSFHGDAEKCDEVHD